MRSRSVRESAIQSGIVAAVRDAGGWAIVTRPPGVPTGTPDIIACLDGRFAAIEVKRPGATATVIQAAQMAAIRSAGGVAVVATSVAEAMAALQ